MTFHTSNQEQLIHLQIDQLKKANSTMRQKTATSLGAMGRTATAAVTALAVTALTESLRDLDFQVRKAAALALGRIGPKAKAAIPALILALRDENEVVRRAAAETLGNMRAEATGAIPALRVMIDHDLEVRKKAALALLKIESDIRAAIIRAA